MFMNAKQIADGHLLFPINNYAELNNFIYELIPESVL